MILKDDIVVQTTYENLIAIGASASYDKSIKRSEFSSISQFSIFCFCSLDDFLRIINDFYRRDDVKKLAIDQGLDSEVFKNVYVSFRKYCMQSTSLPADFNLILNDIVSGSSKYLFVLLFVVRFV